MKKSTLLLAALCGAFYLNAQDQDPSIYTWLGGEDENRWSTQVQNFLNYNPELGVALRTAWANGNVAVFDGGGAAADGATERVSVRGDISPSEIRVSGDRDYTFSEEGELDIDRLVGDGVLIKEGDGDLRMQVFNEMTGGTIIRGGRVIMPNTTVQDVFGSKIVLEDGGIASVYNFGGVNSDKSYIEVKAPIYVEEGQTGTFIANRYTYLGDLFGAGEFHLYSCGERTYLGEEANPANWRDFSGTIYIHDEPTGVAADNSAFGGLILCTTKNFALDDLWNLDNEESLISSLDSTFWNNKLIMADNGFLASRSDNRIYAVGELSSDSENASISGFWRQSDNNWAIYWVGGSNTDAVIKAKIHPFNYYRKMFVGLIKVGTGTYTLTNGNNFITGAIDVREGKVLINNEPIRGSSGTGYRGSTGDSRGDAGPVLRVRNGAAAGGFGIISGDTEVYEGGVLEPGSNGIGTLTFSGYLDRLSDNPYTVQANLHIQGGIIDIEVENAANHDAILIDDYISWETGANGGKPSVRVKYIKTTEVNAGDRILVLHAAKGLHANSSVELPEIIYDENAADGWVWKPEADIDEEEGYKLYLVAENGFVSVKENSIQDEIAVYPNPSNGEFNIVGAEIEKIEVLNSQGQTVYVENVNAASAQLNLNGLTDGIYFAKISSTKGNVIKKLVIGK